MRTLVTGATGYVGSRLVTALLDAGHDVVATTRNPQRLADFGWHDDITGVKLDAHDEASAKNAFAEAGSIDVVYYLVHGIGQPDYRDTDNLAAANVANAAKEAGVRRIVYLGGFVPDEDELSQHLTSRAEVAHALSVGDAHRPGHVGQPRTEGKPGMTLREIREIATTVAEPHHEPPSVVRRRRIVVAVVLVIGAVVLGFSLSQEPGSESFYWWTLALAVVWAVGAFASGPLHLGCVRFRGRNQRPVITGTVVGLAVGAVFLVGGLIARGIPGVREFITRVLEFADQGALPLVVFITLTNGIAEELFFRGALYTALGKAYPAVVSTIIYIVAILATRNPVLAFAAVIVGAICAYERRATGGVLAPMLTHFFWGLIMVLALPPVFGV